MSDEKHKSKDVTEESLSDILDKRFSEQTQIILSAMESRFSAMDKRMDNDKQEIKSGINNVQTLIDAYVKGQEDFRQEFIIMKEEMRKIKKILKDKLGLEVSAI